MTNLEDALVAVEAGADAVGFVFHPASPRKISPELAREIVEKLPERVEKIGVMVTGDEVNSVDVVHRCELTGWQTYISCDAREIPGPKAVGLSCFPKGFRSLMALPMSLFGTGESQIRSLASAFAKRANNLPESFSTLAEGVFETFVLDSGDLRAPGGTGKTFDWDKAASIAEGMRQGGVRLVVAGGLNPENVVDAMKILKPWGVDVASGVEASPGKKDPEKVRAFVKAVREFDRKTN